MATTTAMMGIFNLAQCLFLYIFLFWQTEERREADYRGALRRAAGKDDSYFSDDLSSTDSSSESSDEERGRRRRKRSRRGRGGDGYRVSHPQTLVTDTYYDAYGQPQYAVRQHYN